MKINGKFQPGGIVPGSVTGNEYGESIIPLERLHELISRGDRRRQHHRALCMVIVESLLTPGTTTGYYCSRPVKDIKDQFVKLINELQIEGGAYMDIDNEILFNNGSKIVFISAASCGDFTVVAPDLTPDWVDEIKLFSPTEESKLNARMIQGIWKVKPNNDEAKPL